MSLPRRSPPQPSWRRGELAEPLPRLLVGPDRDPLGPGLARHLLGHAADGGGDRRSVARLAQERLDPAFRQLGLGHLVLDQQLAEEQPDPDVGEGLEGEDHARRVDELGDLRIGDGDLVDDRADRLVDERDPETPPRRGRGRRQVEDSRSLIGSVWLMAADAARRNGPTPRGR